MSRFYNLHRSDRMEQPADKFVKLSSEVEKSFRCCACEKFLHPEIRMCNNGHNMCEECLLEKGSSCHICHQYVEDTSNTQIEALMKQFQVAVPCKNHRSGCTEEVQIGALNLHEVECQFFRRSRLRISNYFRSIGKPHGGGASRFGG